MTIVSHKTKYGSVGVTFGYVFVVVLLYDNAIFNVRIFLFINALFPMEFLSIGFLESSVVRSRLACSLCLEVLLSALRSSLQ